MSKKPAKPTYAELEAQVQQLQAALAEAARTGKIRMTSADGAELAQLRREYAALQDEVVQIKIDANARLTEAYAQVEALDQYDRQALKNHGIAAGLENRLIYALFSLDITAASLDGIALSNVLPACRDRLDKAFKEFKDGLEKFGINLEQSSATRINQYNARKAGIEKALTGLDDGQTLRDIAFSFDDLMSLIWLEAESQRARDAAMIKAQARQETLEAANKARAPKKAEQDRALRDQAIAELRIVRSERPGYGIVRLRDHYVSKYEGRIPAGKEEIYQHIESVAESTLYKWADAVLSDSTDMSVEEFL